MAHVCTGSRWAGGWLLSAALALGACAGESSNPLTPPAPSGSATLLCHNLPQPAATTLDAAGGTVSVSIAAPTGCRWSAEAPVTAPWMTVQNPGPFNGPATVTFSVEPNRAFEQRVGALLLRDGDGRLRPVHKVPQRAATCLYEVSKPTLALGAFGTWDGSGDSPEAVMVTARPATCQWTATASDSWIRIVYDTAQGTGDRTVYVSVAPQWTSPAPRQGSVTIAGLSGVNPDALLSIAQTGR